MAATAVLDSVAMSHGHGDGRNTMLREPTLFDLLGEIQALDGRAVTDPSPATAPGGVGAPTGVLDDQRARHGWPGGEPTLDDLIVEAWEGLTALATVACPICGGSMEPEPARHTGAGRCRDCSTSLS